jgi:5-methylthioadenosine/S-adenosylhomocysteine deaminase
MNILIKNGTILPMNVADDMPKYFKGNLGIEGNKISFVSAEQSYADNFLAKHQNDCKIIDASGCVVMPGLINTHTHIAMTLLRGISDDVPLMEWLNEHIWPIEAHMGYNEILIGAKLGALEMLKGGTTTFVDMYPYEEAVAEASEKAGIRAIVSPCAMDFRMPHFEEDWRAVHNRFSNSKLVSMMIGVHAIYTCSPDNMKHAMELSEQLSTGIHIHHSETQDEEKTVKERYNANPTEHLVNVGLIKRPTLAAHCVYMSDNDIKAFAENNVSVAYNPQSNMKLASGIAPIAKMLDSGVNVSIGTDGASSNNDLDMWDEMRTASLLQKVNTMNPCALTAYQVLQMATVNGAKAIGREGELGILQEGALADVILVNFEKPHLYPHTNLISELVYSCHASDVETVIVDGNVVVENRKCTTMDETKVCTDAQNTIDRLLNQ